MSAYKLSNLIRARFPVIYITTFEEDRVTKYIKSVVTDVKQVKFAREVFTWTQTNGLYNTTTSKTVMIQLALVRCLNLFADMKKMQYL